MKVVLSVVFNAHILFIRGCETKIRGDWFTSPMITEVIPLGIGSAMPTSTRHLAATVLLREGEGLLFDCGEGTQFQLIQAGVRRTRLSAIFITHLHGDHLYGLPGLLSTLAMLHYQHPMTVVGPAALQGYIEQTFALTNLTLPYPLSFVGLDAEFEQGVVLDAPTYTVHAARLDHRVFTVGYRFEEKERPGRIDTDRADALGLHTHAHFQAVKAGEAIEIDGRRIEPHEVVGPPRPGVSFAYCFDTRPCPGALALAQNATLLYHDATFAHDCHDKAVGTGHTTAHEAALLAREAGAHRLLLGHFSARYRDLTALTAEARAIFPNSEAAEELKRYILR